MTGNTLGISEKYKEQQECWKRYRNIFTGNQTINIDYGDVIWYITVLENTEIDFHSLDGDLTVEGTSGHIKVRTACGDVELYNITGKVDVHTLSGDIKAENILLEEVSSFSSLSGNVKVSLAETSKYDISLSSTSGKAVLDYNGNPLQGYFQLTSQRFWGRIKSPVKFENVKRFSKLEYKFIEKSFSKGEHNPRISLNTASGKVALKN